MTDLTQDLAALDAALYMGPTPDPWQASRPDSEGDVTVAGPGGVPIAKCGHATSVLDENHAYVIGYSEAIANAHFIAACSPDRILRLLRAAKARDEEIERLRAEVERLQEIVRPRREDECLTLDHWRMRAYALEANWSRCSRACAIEQDKREQAEARAERLAEALRELEEREQRDEALLRQALEALGRAHQTAMEQTLKARLPECAEFAGIAQDLDFVVAALRERLGKGMEQKA